MRGMIDMMIAKNDEEKRSKMWRFVTGIASIIIILVVAFFITKLFAGNPLDGRWESEENSMTLIFQGNNDLTVNLDSADEGTGIKVKMDYVLDKDAKTITIKVDEAALQKAADKSDGQVTAESLEASLGKISSTFDYSIEQNVLVLAEREYGDQLVFTRQ